MRAWPALLLLIQVVHLAAAETVPPKALLPVRETTLQPMVCLAGSRLKDPRDLGGFGPSNHLPEPAAAADARLGVVVLRQEAGPPQAFLGRYNGIAISLINGTSKPVGFNASDSVVELWQEAQTPEGAWKPLEARPQVFCGNSHHHVILAPGEQWRFTVPVYEGPLATRGRLAVALGDGGVLHSAEYAVSIDPRQWTAPPRGWREPAPGPDGTQP